MGRFWRASRSYRGSTQSGRLTRTEFFMLDRNAWWHNYLKKPVGIRHQEDLRLWCVKCYSENIFVAETKLYTFCRCKDCSFEWDFGPCWNCRQEYVDSRDPANSLCHCGWYRCVLCKACNLMGCKKTNPYSGTYRYSAESHEEDMIEFRCKWCERLKADHSPTSLAVCEKILSE